MVKNIPRVLISADRSSSGKTTISTGIMGCLVDKGLVVQGFKVGLDYIDTGYHTFVTGRFSRNLDGYLMDYDAVVNSFLHASDGADIAVIEGVRGLYEGLDVKTDIGSTYQIAEMLRSPIVLVMDVTSITKSAAAILNGIRNFKSPDIRGVILNKVGGERHKEKLIEAIERYSGIEVIGAVPKDDDIGLPARHFGLVPAKEMIERQIMGHRMERIKKIVEWNIDIERIIEIASDCEKIRAPKKDFFEAQDGERVKIGVAYDEAFNFYYHDNLELLRKNGAEIIFFSPMRDRRLPMDISGLYLGGGHIEVFAEDLSRNKSMKSDIYDKSVDGMPIYAECGGMLYLLERIILDGSDFEMVGVFDGDAFMGSRRVVGYVEGCMTENTIIGRKGDHFRAHEFHHSTVKLRRGKFAYRIRRGEGIVDGRDGLLNNNTLASYSHLHFLSYRPSSVNFVHSCNLFKKMNEK